MLLDPVIPEKGLANGIVADFTGKTVCGCAINWRSIGR
jgi:hypothetical protein